jgi:hypothetical protein
VKAPAAATRDLYLVPRCLKVAGELTLGRYLGQY